MPRIRNPQLHPPPSPNRTTTPPFIATLRNQWRGERAPTSPATNIYSIFDEHRGTARSRTPNASGALNDAPRGVGSVEHRSSKGICTAGLPGGNTEQRPRNHEGVLYNGLGYALAIDALTHPGPGRVERVDAAAECAKFAADGLSLADVLATHALIPLAVGNTLVFEPKVAREPEIRGYARKDIPG
ncbi:hypothetical protein KC316_g9512 [Hortaea werneckii]|nr:hypothetical protein KC324_g9514 [Hortaea werneckii]KAI7579247.1 hypothetical protein KC316_g9512 [Hortaea werneckii]